MRKVMLATPTVDGRVVAEYAYSLAKSVVACVGSIDLIPVLWPGEAILHHARNMLVSLAVESKIDEMLWIDADQSWEPQDLVRLLNFPVDVVGAPVRKRTDENEGYNVRAKSAEIPVDEQTGLWLVDSVGTGFLRVSMRAVMAVWEKSEPYSNGNQKTRAVFEVPVLDGRIWGEDVLFCAKLADAGFRCHVDADIAIGHIGPKNFRGNFRAWIQRLKGTQAG